MENSNSSISAITEGVSKPLYSKIGLWVGLVLAIGIQFSPAPEGLSSEAWIVVSLAVLMATWWVSEAIPLPVTSLLPLVVLPSFGVLPFKAVAVPYSSPIVLLLLGGFIIAKSVERWNLHTRLALNIVIKAGSKPTALIGGFMLASALLSMWISNSATTIMLTPIGLSVALAISGNMKVDNNLAVGILLAIAYGASIGGLATPIGTPTNLIVIGYLDKIGGQNIGFLEWMSIGIPVVGLLLPAAWFTLTRWGVHISSEDGESGHRIIKSELKKLGNITQPEVRTILAFSVIALAWIIRRPMNSLEIFGTTPFSQITDHVIAIFGVIILFLIPAGSKHNRDEALLNWETAKNIPWGILLLFGGGLSLALAITQSGLAVWLAERMSILTTAPHILLIFVLVVVVIFSTEIVSNVATASAILPVIGALSVAGKIDPVLLSIPVGLAASCAFMLPMATGPNAVVFASGKISMKRMAVTGFKLNLLAIALITAIVWWLTPYIFL